MPKTKANVLPVDTAINSDGYNPGISQAMTLDEVKDIYMSQASRADRLTAMKNIKREILARNKADVETGFDALLAEIDRGIGYLEGGTEGYAEPNTLRTIQNTERSL